MSLLGTKARYYLNRKENLTLISFERVEPES